ncbi:hypothetical protein RRG08_026583 [Elysia crispata]|uniref:Uncharacterized protein n=1 Tax=Elysia crispata TaxID=231223 RepID=A0AAE0Y3X4_9GAST|nr:hypothetical protein RRG08_026583 [Elysia crispata]
MEPGRIPRQLLYGELSQGKRKQGRPQKRYKDNLKVNLAHAEVPPKQLEVCSQDWVGWRIVIKEETMQ